MYTKRTSQNHCKNYDKLHALLVVPSLSARCFLKLRILDVSAIWRQSSEVLRLVLPDGPFNYFLAPLALSLYKLFKHPLSSFQLLPRHALNIFLLTVDFRTVQSYMFSLEQSNLAIAGRVLVRAVVTTRSRLTPARPAGLIFTV